MKTQTFSIHSPMSSGVTDQIQHKYHKVVGKEGNWYIAVTDTPADNIYFASNSGKHSDGFGGSTLTFILEDGTEERVQGPWHSNASSLFEDTGYNILDKYLTKGIVAKNRMYSVNCLYEDVYEDVLHYDEEPVIGEFNRIEKIAQEWANTLGCTIAYGVRSQGGGTSSWVKPNNK